MQQLNAAEPEGPLAIEGKAMARKKSSVAGIAFGKALPADAPDLQSKKVVVPPSSQKQRPPKPERNDDLQIVSERQSIIKKREAHDTTGRNKQV